METQNEFLMEKNFEKKKKLAEMVFKKAENDSMETTRTALAYHIEANTKLSYKTLTRFYGRYIQGDISEVAAMMSTLNLTSQYIEYDDFSDFCKKNFSEENLKEEIKVEEESLQEDKNGHTYIPPISSKLKNILIGTGLSTVLGLGSYFGISEFEAKAETAQVENQICMYWDESHYEKINCNDVISPHVEKKHFEEELFKYFRKLEVNDTTTFFEAGKAIVWYVKVDGKPEFYSAPGNHPISGKPLREVTPYIINKYVLEKK